MPDRSNARLAGLVALAGAGLAAVGILGMSAAEPPYLSFDGVDFWAVVYAAGLFAALGALPFALHARARERVEDVDRHWELALSQWGGLTLLAGLVFVAVGAIGSFDSDTVGGAVATAGIAECALIIAALVVLLLTTG